MDERGTINGAALAFGRGTFYGPQKFMGLDHPVFRTADTPRYGDDGTYGGVDFVDGRTVQIDMQVRGSASTLAAQRSAYDSLVAALSAAMVPQTNDIMLALDNGNRVVFCRPRGMTGDRGYADLGKRGVYRLRFDARDPRIYAGSLSSLTSPLPVALSGFVPPLVPPLAMSASSGGGSVVATNGGSYAVKPVAVITNCTAANPRIENVTAGKTVRVNLTLASTDVLVIDFDGKTIDLVTGGTVNFDTLKTAGLTSPASRRGALDTSSAWWALSPGDNEIRFTADSYDANARMTLTWRSAYLAI